MTKDHDPEIPFHVSDSNRIAAISAGQKVLLSLNSVELTLLVTFLIYWGFH